MNTHGVTVLDYSPTEWKPIRTLKHFVARKDWVGYAEKRAEQRRREGLR